jgi:hypothetical protein
MKRSVSGGYTDPRGDDGWMECGSRIFGKGDYYGNGPNGQGIEFLALRWCGESRIGNGDLRGALKENIKS